MRNTIRIVLFALLALILTACGSAIQAASPTPTQDPDAPVINLKLSEYAFTPDRIKLKVGQEVTLHVTNGGATDHELMIGRNPLRDESGKLGDGFEQDFFATTKPTITGDGQVMGMEAGGMDNAMGSATPEGTETMGNMGDMGMENGLMVMLEPKQESTITFTVDEAMLGTWTMGCFEEGQGQIHFDEGMAGIVYVLPE